MVPPHTVTLPVSDAMQFNTIFVFPFVHDFFALLQQILRSSSHIHILWNRTGCNQSICRTATLWPGHYTNISRPIEPRPGAAHICGGRRGICQIGKRKMRFEHYCERRIGGG